MQYLSTRGVRMPIRLTELRNKCAILLFLIGGSSAWAADHSQFTVQKFHRDANGVTFKTTAGVMRVEVCGDSVVHVVASFTSEIPPPKVPIAIQQCEARNLQVASKSNEVRLSTSVITVAVNR